MKNIVVVGMQWGDEGKGKIVDLMAPHFDIVARYQGGHNAGHTVMVGGKKFVLHLLPSGIVHTGKSCVIGNGVVIDPTALLSEMDELGVQGIDVTGRLHISNRAHIILPHHLAIERTSEQRRGIRQVGTTLRGIGPAYEDKIGRRGLRAGNFLHPDRLKRQLEEIIGEANDILQMRGSEPIALAATVDDLLAKASRIAPFVTDTATWLNREMSAGKSVLFEGAQGTMLDIDHGTYPYVTSSSGTAGGATVGTGVPPTALTGVLGIMKAYTTRVGSGPFPTELTDATGERLRARGHEYGASTGRPRRCGWFDGVVARYARMINGLTTVALMKLDVLDDFETIDICTGYRLHGNVIDTIPHDAEDLEAVEPIYETLPGWQASTVGLTDFKQLPTNAQHFIARLEALIGCDIGLVSTGPDRHDTIVRAGSQLANWLN
ncbi:MAG: adenylosuccinate synthase [Acidobacteriota bacterium]